MKASNQWMSRPADERFTSLDDMQAMLDKVRSESRAVVVPSRRMFAQPEVDNVGLRITGPNGHAYTPTHHAFGQLCQLAEAPAGYLRTMPSPIAADCVNYGLQFKRAIEDVGVLLQRNSDNIFRAATGPNYGRVWNADLVQVMRSRFGNGLDGDFRVPGEFGRAVAVTKENTTLYASDRDMFVFLADEQHRIEIPNRRNGEAGSMARGFFVWNSEVGDKTLGLAMFLFDYVCCNRIVWGAQQYKELRIRHTVSAPDKWLDEVQPVLLSYANSETKSVTDAIAAAQEKKVDDLDKFLQARFTKSQAAGMKLVHTQEEGRPIETLWDVSTAATAYARGIGHIDARVEIERKAGEVLDLAA
jgi:hypothetical protein